MFYLQLIPEDGFISDMHNKKTVTAKEEARKLNVVLLTVSQLSLFNYFVILNKKTLSAMPDSINYVGHISSKLLSVTLTQTCHVLPPFPKYHSYYH